MGEADPWHVSSCRDPGTVWRCHSTGAGVSASTRISRSEILAHKNTCSGILHRDPSTCSGTQLTREHDAELAFRRVGVDRLAALVGRTLGWSLLRAQNKIAGRIILFQCLDLGSGLKLQAIWHGAGAYSGVFSQKIYRADYLQS